MFDITDSGKSCKGTLISISVALNCVHPRQFVLLV
uniref:Uncharacterized protein n=1 Tax=Rhizophora mucronata TaxID=61149 RepID=A0A2P2ISJ5_RHIMU